MVLRKHTQQKWLVTMLDVIGREEFWCQIFTAGEGSFTEFSIKKGVHCCSRATCWLYKMWFVLWTSELQCFEYSFFGNSIPASCNTIFRVRNSEKMPEDFFRVAGWKRFYKDQIRFPYKKNAFESLAYTNCVRSEKLDNE